MKVITQERCSEDMLKKHHRWTHFSLLSDPADFTMLVNDLDNGIGNERPASASIVKAMSPKRVRGDTPGT